MTFDEATALQPAWVGIWLNILLFGAFILPFALLFWKESRMTGIVTLVSSALSAAGVIWIFNELGYVKLMGLSHIIFWTPLVFSCSAKQNIRRCRCGLVASYGS